MATSERKRSSAIEIRHGTLADAPGYQRCLDLVARERRYLGLVEAPDLAVARGWIESLIHTDFPFVVAARGREVVGWCDIAPDVRSGFTHLGRLGIGVHPEFRGQGIGPRLLALALAKAEALGLERIELEVFASNERAVAVYLKFGFVVEGRRRKARKLDGGYDDDLIMAKLIERRADGDA